MWNDESPKWLNKSGENYGVPKHREFQGNAISKCQPPPSTHPLTNHTKSQISFSYYKAPNI